MVFPNNTNLDNEQISILNIQQLATIIYVGSLLISIFITQNEIQGLKKHNQMISEKQQANLSKFNRTLILVLTATYLYISYKNRNIAREEKEALWPFNLDIFTSYLSIIAAIITLYIVFATEGEEYFMISGISNPNI